MAYELEFKHELEKAIDLWISDRDAAIANYGEINSWMIYSIDGDFSGIFKNRTTFNEDISGWNISNVNNFSSMFEGATSFDQDITGWRVNSGADFQDMFKGATSMTTNNGAPITPSPYSYFQYYFDSREALENALDLWISDKDNALSTYGNINNWNIDAISDLSYLFDDFKFNQFNDDISGWSVGHVTNFTRMFGRASSFNQNISSWDVSSGNNFNEMFYKASSFDQDISNWDVRNTADFTNMFKEASSMNSNQGVSSTPNVVNYFGSAYFLNKNELLKALEAWVDNEEYAKTIYGEISNWDISRVKDFSYLFNSQGIGGVYGYKKLSEFNSDISNWDVSHVTDFSFMFGSHHLYPTNGSLFNQDISKWDVSSGTNFAGMFAYSEAFNQDISNWDVSNGKDFSYMFTNSVFNQDIGNWDVSNGTDFKYMFSGTNSFNQDIGSWEVGNGTSFKGMFEQADGFDQDISNWDVSNGIGTYGDGFSYMFQGADIFSQDLTPWNISSSRLTEFESKWYAQENASYANVLATFNDALLMPNSWQNPSPTFFADNFFGKTIRGDDTSEIINGGQGNDVIYSSEGNDIIDGGAGNDKAIYSGKFSDYTFSLNSGNIQINGQGKDILQNIEIIKFNDVLKSESELRNLAEPPIIIGPFGSVAGSSTSTVSIYENNTEVHTFKANQIVTWSLNGLYDNALFSINSSSGALSFSSAPDYESPGDRDRDNDHIVVVRATNSAGNTSDQILTVSVANNQELDVSNHQVGTSYNLAYIKDYDGNLHANTGSVSDETKTSYKYQGLIDVNADGTKEAIYTNKESGRWVTASINSFTGEIDYSDHGQGGTTRVVGIYIDPLVTSGEVEQFGPHDSQLRFQNDLKIDNLIAKTSGDYDGDGFQEVYWKTNDGTAYLRALMHADGNIQYANYQSEEQMSDYLTSKGYADVINDIV